MIKQKVGRCIDCPPGSEEQPLIAKRCNFHYWAFREKVNKDKPKNIAKKLQGKVMGIYFASQVLVMPERCEESGQLLPKSPAWMRKACIAHILKKRADYGFPSVAIHPLNRIFLHPDIHTNMDNLGERYILKMKSLPLMRERVKKLLPLLTADELNRVPWYFL